MWGAPLGHYLTNFEILVLQFPLNPINVRAMRACTKKERLEREKEARQEAAERISRVRNK